MVPVSITSVIFSILALPVKSISATPSASTTDIPLTSTSLTAPPPLPPPKSVINKLTGRSIEGTVPPHSNVNVSLDWEYMLISAFW